MDGHSNLLNFSYLSPTIRINYIYNNHPSEMGILDFDFKIQNTTIEDLENQIKIVLKEIL